MNTADKEANNYCRILTLLGMEEEGDPVAEVERLVAAAELVSASLVAPQEVRMLRKALEEGRRAIGDHFAPDDCYATGPLTGNAHKDLVECPACSFIAMYDAIKEQAVKPATDKEQKC